MAQDLLAGLPPHPKAFKSAKPRGPAIAALVACDALLETYREGFPLTAQACAEAEEVLGKLLTEHEVSRTATETVKDERYVPVRSAEVLALKARMELLEPIGSHNALERITDLMSRKASWGMDDLRMARSLMNVLRNGDPTLVEILDAVEEREPTVADITLQKIGALQERFEELLDDKPALSEAERDKLATLQQDLLSLRGAWDAAKHAGTANSDLNKVEAAFRELNAFIEEELTKPLPENPSLVEEAKEEAAPPPDEEAKRMRLQVLLLTSDPPLTTAFIAEAKRVGVFDKGDTTALGALSDKLQRYEAIQAEMATLAAAEDPLCFNAETVRRVHELNALCVDDRGIPTYATAAERALRDEVVEALSGATKFLAQIAQNTLSGAKPPLSEEACAQVMAAEQAATTWLALQPESEEKAAAQKALRDFYAVEKLLADGELSPNEVPMAKELLKSLSPSGLYARRITRLIERAERPQGAETMDQNNKTQILGSGATGDKPAVQNPTPETPDTNPKSKADQAKGEGKPTDTPPDANARAAMLLAINTDFWEADDKTDAVALLANEAVASERRERLRALAEKLNLVTAAPPKEPPAAPVQPSAAAPVEPPPRRPADRRVSPNQTAAMRLLGEEPWKRSTCSEARGLLKNSPPNSIAADTRKALEDKVSTWEQENPPSQKPTDEATTPVVPAATPKGNETPKERMAHILINRPSWDKATAAEAKSLLGSAAPGELSDAIRTQLGELVQGFEATHGSAPAPSSEPPPAPAPFAHSPVDMTDAQQLVKASWWNARDRERANELIKDGHIPFDVRNRLAQKRDEMQRAVHPAQQPRGSRTFTPSNGSVNPLNDDWDSPPAGDSSPPSKGKALKGWSTKQLAVATLAAIIIFVTIMSAYTLWRSRWPLGTRPETVATRVVATPAPATAAPAPEPVAAPAPVAVPAAAPVAAPAAPSARPLTAADLGASDLARVPAATVESLDFGLMGRIQCPNPPRTNRDGSLDYRGCTLNP